jgi:plasmid stability protein
MANLTIVIDDRLLQAARIKAAQQGTSVNEVCRDAIARFAQADQEVQERIDRLRAIAGRARPGQGSGWPGRERFYDEVLEERGLLGTSVPAARTRPAR